MAGKFRILFWLLLLGSSATAGAASTESDPSKNEVGADPMPAIEDRSVPKTWCVRVKAVYNNGFMKKAKENEKEPKEAINEIIAKANEIFSWEGLGVRITLQLANASPEDDPEANNWYPGSYSLRGKLVRKHAGDSTVDYTVLLTDQVGYSFGHTYAKKICSPSNVWKVGIICYQNDLLQDAANLASLLAFSIGASKDAPRKGDRISKTSGQNCTGVHGLMNKEITIQTDRWSECSKEDLIAAYAYWKGKGRFCLTCSG